MSKLIPTNLEYARAIEKAARHSLINETASSLWTGVCIDKLNKDYNRFFQIHISGNQSNYLILCTGVIGYPGIKDFKLYKNSQDAYEKFNVFVNTRKVLGYISLDMLGSMTQPYNKMMDKLRKGAVDNKMFIEVQKAHQAALEIKAQELFNLFENNLKLK